MLGTMLPLPNLTPPTDNLYKFIAILGLLLLFGPIGFITYQYGNATLLNEDAKAEVDRLDAQYKSLGAEFDELMRRADATQQVDESKMTLAEMESRVAFLKANMVEVRKNEDERAKTFAALKATDSMDAQTEKAIRSLFYWTSPCADLALVGALLAGTGFTLWWRRVQRWQDAVLLAQAKNPPPAPKA